MAKITTERQTRTRSRNRKPPFSPEGDLWLQMESANAEGPLSGQWLAVLRVFTSVTAPQGR